MNETMLDHALDELVPDCSDALESWDDVLRRAARGAAHVDAAGGRQRRRRRRLLAVAVAIAATAVALLATPAFGIRQALLDLIGRSDVAFTGKPAPFEIRRDFADLSLGAPPGMAPQALPGQARRVGVFRDGSRRRALFVVPTKNGGFCYLFVDAFGGCRPSRTPPPSHLAPEPGMVNSFALGLTWQSTVRAGETPYATQIGGAALIPDAQTIEVEYEDGSTGPIRFVFISQPIDAAFYLFAIPRGHDRVGTRVRAVTALDANGNVLARQPIGYEGLTTPPRPAPTHSPPGRSSPKLPPPTAPLQRGAAGGVRVTAGRNRVAVFDTTGATPDVRRLIARGEAGYGCFGFQRYHRVEPASVAFERRTLPRVAIRVFGVDAPFDGCEIQGTYGHRWPDQNGSHSAVEIAFTERGRRYFADRAAARDLALFVRSREQKRLRALSPEASGKRLAELYGASVERLPRVGAPLAPNRVGYVVGRGRMTFVERSTTGRRFLAVVEDGRIVRENVRPLAFVF